MESGGDNLTATFSKGLVDAQIFVIDVAGGDDIPRKGGPGVTTADLLVVNKTDLAPYVGADLDRMAADAAAQRGELPVVFTSVGPGRRHRPGGRVDRRKARRLDRGAVDDRRGRAVRAVARMRAVADGRGGTALPLLAGRGRWPCAGPAVRAGRRAGDGGRRDERTAGRRPAADRGGGGHGRAPAGRRVRRHHVAARRERRTGGYDVALSVADGAELRWLPEPVIAARGSALRMSTRVELAPGARLVLREEQILGRCGEPPAHLTTRLTVRRGGRTLLDQELSFGPGATPGWDGPAVLGGHRAVGQLLVVSEEFEPAPRPTAPPSRHPHRRTASSASPRSPARPSCSPPSPPTATGCAGS